ncbi:MAG TPA: hypothetical protein PKY35_14100 [Candidatus Hydrogenedentes bacterium]|nr:hypothetical protein [Candidatus Hydrogenedentota bacterium]HOL78153.1 hypothetical protein [Candidatus Hydrogenedentota bacterium]HPO87240.1 hypothetical protein [Candidatus Hydrogenedentota bacterium]
MFLNKPDTRSSHLLFAALFAVPTLLALFSAFPGIGATFLADDHVLVETGRTIVEHDPLLPFRGHFSGSVAPGLPAYYRPLFALSFAWDHFVWDYNPFGYHLTNVILHLANTGLLYVLLRRIVTRDETALPWLSATFFAVHPLHDLAVNWISGRGDLLCAFFMLCSVWLFLIFLQRGSRVAFLFSCISGMCAMASKETALVLPAILIGFWVTCLPSSFSSSEVWAVVKPMAPFAALALFFIVTRLYLFGYDAFFPSHAGGVIQNCFWTLRRLIFPWTISLKEMVRIHPIVLFGLSLGFVLVFLPLVPRMKKRLALFGLVWLALTFLPVATLANPWRVYVPTIGFCILLGVLTQPTRNIKGKFALAATVLFLLISGVELKDRFHAWRLADNAARNIEKDFVFSYQAGANYSPIFLCIPGMIGDIPVYMFGLDIRLRWAIGRQDLSPVVCSYVVLPPAYDPRAITLTRESDTVWRIALSDPRSRFEFPDIPEWSSATGMLQTGMTHTTFWGTVEISGVNAAGKANEIVVDITPRYLEGQRQVYFFSNGRLRAEPVAKGDLS